MGSNPENIGCLWRRISLHGELTLKGSSSWSITTCLRTRMIMCIASAVRRAPAQADMQSHLPRQISEERSILLNGLFAKHCRYQNFLRFRPRVRSRGKRIRMMTSRAAVLKDILRGPLIVALHQAFKDVRTTITITEEGL